jgi:hypothetical protein
MESVALSFLESSPAAGYCYERADTDPPTETPHKFLTVRELDGAQAGSEEWVYQPRGPSRAADGGAAGELFGRGDILVVLTRPLPGRDEEYNRWYDERHLGDVLNVIGGFTAARRFTRIGDGPGWQYLAVYEIPAGQLNQCVQRLAWSRVEREEAFAAGREPAVPLSPGLDPERCAWWYSPLAAAV